MLNDIREWIKRISIPHEKIGGFAVCPFAKKATYEVRAVHSPADIVISEQDFDVVIYGLDDPITEQQMMDACRELNIQYPNLVFLPDHKDRNTYINGVQTNNGKHNLILCQRRDKLKDARIKLSATSYYTFWDKEYLKEIMEM